MEILYIAVSNKLDNPRNYVALKEEMRMDGGRREWLKAPTRQPVLYD